MITQEVLKQSVYYDSTLKENVIDKFCKKQGEITSSNNEFFSQHWQGFAWATVLGIIKNKRLKLDNSKYSSFKMNVISNQSSLIFESLILIAISKSDDWSELLDHPSSIVEILSEYAKGGAQHIIDFKMTPGKSDYFNNPQDFIDEIQQRKSL